MLTNPSESIERESLRQAMLEALRTSGPQDYVTFQGKLAVVLKSRDFPVTSNSSGLPPSLRHQDQRRYRELIWSLINEGILVQGMNESNPQWPFLSLTEWGEEYVRSDSSPDVYDPEGYLRTLDQSDPLDEVERRFLGQAIGAFRANLPDASAVMLGAASEHLLLRLGKAIATADPSQTAITDRRLNGPVLGLLSSVQGYLEANKKALPRTLQDDVQTTFAGVASLIRAVRNDSGHPGRGTTSRAQAYTNLQLFTNYRRWVAEAIAHLPLPNAPP